ncbi:hypothetical protein BH11BAC1_BH11BAC1_06340 [soil metagenome]
MLHLGAVKGFVFSDITAGTGIAPSDFSFRSKVINYRCLVETKLNPVIMLSNF